LERQIAWLSNLHYWTVLCLLYLGNSTPDTNLIGRAQSHMIGCLYPLGQLLASRDIGIPFDALALNFGPGMDRDSSRSWGRRLVHEIVNYEPQLVEHLPALYSRSVAAATLRALGETTREIA